ncbi:MAG: ATP-binding cassette domain-containing protein, partial [Anaerolineae bacterium]
MTEPAIALRACFYRYGASVPALRGITCTVDVGSWVSIVGQNGSGKTTLAKLCNGLLRPQAGTVRIMGEDIRGLPVGELARQVGYLFQNP